MIAMSHYNWSKIPAEKITDKLSRKFISGKSITLAQFSFKKDCTVVAHSHKSEQMTCVLKGVLRLRLPDREVTLGEGEVLHIPPGIEHSAVALEDTLVLDVFSPVRKDWLSGEDAYLRK